MSTGTAIFQLDSAPPATVNQPNVGPDLVAEREEIEAARQRLTAQMQTQRPEQDALQPEPLKYTDQDQWKIESARKRLQALVLQQLPAGSGSLTLTETVVLQPPRPGIPPIAPEPKFDSSTVPTFPNSAPFDTNGRYPAAVLANGKPIRLQPGSFAAYVGPDKITYLGPSSLTTPGMTYNEALKALGVDSFDQLDQKLVVYQSEGTPPQPGDIVIQVNDGPNGPCHIIIRPVPPNPGTPGIPGTDGSNVDVSVTANREQTALGHAPRAHLNAVPGVTGSAGLELNSEALGGVAQVTASTNVLNDKVELLAGGTYLLSNGETVGDVEGTGQLVGQAGYRVTDRFKVVGGAFQLFDAQIGGTTLSLSTTVNGQQYGESQSTTIIDQGNPGGLYAGVNAKFQLGTNTEIKTQATVNQTLWGNDPYGTPTPTLRGDVQLQRHFGDFSLAAAAGTSYRTGYLPEGATRANYNLSLAASVALGRKPGGWESAIVGGEAPGQTGQVVVTPELTATTMNHKQDGPNPDVAWLTAYQVRVKETVTQDPDGTFSGAWVVQFQPNDIPDASAQALQIGPVSGKSREEIDELRTIIEGAADDFKPNLQRSGVTRKLMADDAAVAAQLLSTFQEKLPGVPLAPIDATAVPTGEEISSSLAAAEDASTAAEIEAQRAQQVAVIQQATDVLAGPVTGPLTPAQLEQRRAAIAALTPNGTIHRVVIGTDGELVASQAGVAVDPQNIIDAGNPLHSQGVVGNDPVPDGALDLVVMGEDGTPVAPPRPGSAPGQVQAASPAVGQPGIKREEDRLTLQQAGVIK